MGAALTSRSAMSDTMGSGNTPQGAFGNINLTPDTSSASYVVPSSDGCLLVPNTVVGVSSGKSIKPVVIRTSAVETAVLAQTVIQYFDTYMVIGTNDANQSYAQIIFVSTYTTLDHEQDVLNRLVQVYTFNEDDTSESNQEFKFATLAPGSTCLQISSKVVNISIPYSPNQLLNILENSLIQTTQTTSVSFTMYLQAASSNGQICTLGEMASPTNNILAEISYTFKNTGGVPILNSIRSENMIVIGQTSSA